MSNGSAPLLQSPVQSRGSALSLYEAAAAEVGDDTAGSAIIRHIMAISQATADVHTAEVSKQKEADIGRSEQDAPEDEASGSVDGRTVLARSSTQPCADHAPTNSSQNSSLRPCLIPTEAYPPSRSAASPINVDMYSAPIDVDAFDRKSPTSIHNTPLD